ncbi:BTB/POZ domain-containing protein 17 [Tupaia chinensis]|uniref:BTB/POZ domain-containing protein 17 n=1 Tax=Tupaia chinensis TaxID=246437 RepID=L9L4L7_TUPCH|nr:BTB/POZ domain-containing protein 17 [Tupaia chinensis]
MLRTGSTKPGSWGGFWAVLTLVGLTTRAAQRADVGGEAAGTSINHSQTLLQRLQELLRQGNASDVVLRVQAAGTDEVRVFHTHRLLLGLHSERFRELLRNQSELVLQEPRDCAAVFDKFVRYLYCGELNVQLAQAIPLHRLATKYGVASLQRGVADYMRAHLAGGAGPAVGWYHYAVSTGDEALRESCLQFLAETCLQFLAWNLSAVAGSAEWGAVSPELLAQLLRRSDLVLQGELELFHQSSEEAGDFLANADLQRRNSEYLVENALHLHLIVKPVYHTLIRTPK